MDPRISNDNGKRLFNHVQLLICIWYLLHFQSKVESYYVWPVKHSFQIQPHILLYYSVTHNNHTVGYFHIKITSPTLSYKRFFMYCYDPFNHHQLILEYLRLLPPTTWWKTKTNKKAETTEENSPFNDQICDGNDVAV